MFKSFRVFILSIILFFTFLNLSLANSQEKNIYYLNIDSKQEISYEKQEILVTGKTNLPDNTMVGIFLYYNENKIAARKTFIKEGEFKAKFIFLPKKRLAFGDYLIEARVIAARQTYEEVVEILGQNGEKIEEVAEGVILVENPGGEKMLIAGYKFRLGTEAEILILQEKIKEEMRIELAELDEFYNIMNTVYQSNQQALKEGIQITEETWQEAWGLCRNRLVEIDEKYAPGGLAMICEELRRKMYEAANFLLTFGEGYVYKVKEWAIKTKPEVTEEELKKIPQPPPEYDFTPDYLHSFIGDGGRSIERLKELLNPEEETEL